MTRHLGFITTSWPSTARPWAGHFIASLADSFVANGVKVSVVAPRFADDGELEKRNDVSLHEAFVESARPEGLSKQWRAWPKVMWALSMKSRSVRVERWLAHWWPSMMALPLSARVTSVLHGSDMELLERMPSVASRVLASRGPVIAVAPGLASRFVRCSGGNVRHPKVCPLGAHRASETEAVPSFANSWIEDTRPKVLTVARPAVGKGLAQAKAVSTFSKSFAYLVVGEPLVPPHQVRALLRHADLCVIPSRDGKRVPSEGRPHIIAQALVAGVPCVGGPNLAVRQAMREFDQVECKGHDDETLARTITEALQPDRYPALRQAAERVGSKLTWQAVTRLWMREMS